mmetsp:Transcript_13436/g.40635  ORF Transcript_13436/g.40635 Transcript_13436/m.40635 type:complete len:492 (-) Transcript_13436:416-1891(-)|eukprot:CAMPEP_0206149270 /NCGR_PEP_ID=MMETSP1473-20131121/37694_1 /ASSEMBLY_ACC=CAM_ASM_001109 /TAXON_ID=1461547 /ORGANISM="Stichococcus sp, Strain RCC1054" /LENGTH=491 /DNA_ID=CAMNT_0053546725 /DNA_START=43 /DNA_END=1518 /DNA_ORIENTATION=+
MGSPVTTYSTVAELDGSEAAASRYGRLTDAFQKRFGAKPEVFARAPGRVNLIGEHIDYMGYGVLPMAINQDTVVAIRRGGDQVVVTSIHPQDFADCTYGADPAQEVDTNNHQWANYFMCAYKGVFEFLESKGVQQKPVGLQVMVHGTVPQGAGVSSSAALVCSSALALLAAYNAQATPAEVAEFACTCERYVGTQSGGMDQAISMMAASGVAKLINFHPVRAEDVFLPQEATFVIANSLAESQKAVTADKCYNLRVVECRLAAVLLTLALGHPREKALKMRYLKEVEALLPPAASAQDSFHACLDAACSHLHGGTYDQQEIEKLLGQSLADFFHNSPANIRVVTAAGGQFKLQDRAVHVWGEAARVPAFRDACNDGAASAPDKLRRLAQLMDDSHASCRDLYECSCRELEEVRGAAVAAGALGSRLTGAGWGGCTVSLVEQGQEQAFIAAVKEAYYRPLQDSGRLEADPAWDDIIFASKPASGGAILRLDL